MRHVLAGGGSIIALAVLGAFLITYRTSALQPAVVNRTSVQTITEAHFAEIALGSQSTVKSRVNYLITSQEGLTKLWKIVNTSVSEPKVDFTTHAVIAVFAGEQQTGGFQIRVAKIEDGSMRNVVVALAKPGPDCMVAQMITTPYQIVTVSVTSLSFTHNDLETTFSCGQAQ